MKVMFRLEKPGSSGVVVVGAMPRRVFSASSTLPSEMRVKVSRPSEPSR